MAESLAQYFKGRGTGVVRMSELPEGIRQQFQESIISPAIAQRYVADFKFLSRNEAELRRQFPDKKIAIKGFTVLSAKDTNDELLESLKKMGEKPGLVLRWSLEDLSLPFTFISPRIFP